MKKKFIGVSYESNDGVWRVDHEGDHFHFIENNESELILTLSLSQLSELSELFSGILTDLGVKESALISNIGNSFTPPITHTIDPRFHPDPDGLLSL